MALEKKLTARNIVNEAGMSERPEYYSGRGATLVDLRPEHLQKIHDLISEKHGKEAAQNFVEMVANMNDLAASNFLTCLFHLEALDWKYDGSQSDILGGVAVAQNRDGSYDFTHGGFGMLMALSSFGRDETEAIRRPFLASFGYKPRFHQFP